MKQWRHLPITILTRLVGLCLFVAAGIMTYGLLSSGTAYAATNATVSVCNESHLRSAIAKAGDGGTVNFICSGTITLAETLVIDHSLTLDGTGQIVTLSGGDAVQVILVNPRVVFTLKNLTIAHGFTGGQGGGLENSHGTVNIMNSTFTDNSANDTGGGLFNQGPGRVNITNSTFTNNTSGTGGALDNNGITSITNSTIANNIANIAGGLDNANGGTLLIAQSIVANNIAGSDPNGNCSSGLIDQGYNLESGTDCGFKSTGSLQNTNPQLGPLANNGGSTRTLALQSTSPAINTIPPSVCAVATDQRGVSRPQGPRCDMGAFEFSFSQGQPTSLNSHEGKHSEAHHSLINIIILIKAQLCKVLKVDRAN